MKVIFLDFDGVITTEKSRYNLDYEALDLLGKIIKATDAKIVVSSSWRRMTLNDTIEFLSRTDSIAPKGFPYIDEIVGVTSRMYAFKHGERDNHYSVMRGVVINQYLEENSNVKSYVILDDNIDILLCQAHNFVKTDTCIGLTEKDVQKAIKILNSNEKKEKTDE